MSVSDRLKKLEQRPQPQRPHGMSQEELALHMDALTPREQDSSEGGTIATFDLHMDALTPREQDAFIKTMTDDDLSASIDYLTTLSEHDHAKP